MKSNTAASILARSKVKRFSARSIERAASMLGRSGGLIGGHARADALDQETRSEIASHAANMRWGKPCGCSFCRLHA